MSIISPARIRLLLSAVLVLACAAVVSVGVAPPGSAASAPLRPGTGYRLPGGDFVGFYLTRAGVKVYGIDPGKRAPRSVSLASIGRYRGMSQRTADELAYALRTWGDARTRRQAAVESQLVNTIVGGNSEAVRRRVGHLPRSIGSRVMAHLRIVRARRGPYDLTLRTPGAPAAPGQSATGSVTLTSGAGKGMPGMTIRLRGSANVTVPATVRTGSRGSATVRYTITGPGPVRLDAAATGLAATRFTGTRPAAGQQRMVTWSATVGASAHTGFQARLGSFSHSYACTTTCTGHPSTTLRACAAPGAYESRLVFRAGVATQSLDFPASARTRCRSLALVLADRDRVTATWTFRTPHGWTRPVVAGGGFVVDCPAVPAVQVSLGYDCVQGSFAAAATAPPTHPVALLITGAATQRVQAASGTVARFTAAVHCGTVQTYTVQVGVRRGDGSWNYGPAARISTPGAPRQP